MEKTTIAHAGLATTLAAAMLGMAAGPATAAETPAGTHAVAGDGAVSSEGPVVILTYDSERDYGDTIVMQNPSLFQAGKPVKFWIEVPARSGSTYTDVRLDTAVPGSTSGCDTSAIDGAGGGLGLACPVTLSPLKANETRTYWVHLTGKRDGKPFSVWKSVRLWAPDVRLSVSVNGRPATGREVTVPRSGSATVEYRVENRTPRTMTDVYSGYLQSRRCTAKDVKPWGTSVCRFTVPGAEIAEQEGGYTLEGIYGKFGESFAFFNTTPPTTIVAR